MLVPTDNNNKKKGREKLDEIVYIERIPFKCNSHGSINLVKAPVHDLVLTLY